MSSLSSSFIADYVEYLNELRKINPRSYLKVSMTSNPDDVIYYYNGLSSYNDNIQSTS